MAEGEDVTLCIAAQCEDGKTPCIVFCSDRKVTYGSGADYFGASDTADKLSLFIKNWPALIAGTMARGEELIDTYRTYFRSLEKHRSELTKANILDTFKIPPRIQRRKLAEEYTQSHWSISYDEFLATGATIFPDDYKERLDDIEEIELDCRLLLGGFLDGEAYVFRVSQNTNVSLITNFAAIGSGETFAAGALHRRKQAAHLSLEETIYNVFEAKKVAQMDPFVGKKTFVDVIRPVGKATKRGAQRVRIDYLNNQGLGRANGYYKQFGLQPVKKIQFQKADYRRY